MFKITLETLKSCFLATLFILFISCTEDPTEPTNGVDGANGFNALVEVQNEDPGANCSSGGVKISVGQDANQNGVLDESEIASISFVCKGADGTNGSNGTTLVARTSPETPGDNCENGGTLVEIGADDNDNSALDDDEVQNSFYVCNGLEGADGSGAGENGLTSLIRATPLEDCGAGGTTGIRIEIGLDANNNGVLDTEPSEIQSTYEICDGADGIDGLNTLLVCTSEGLGENCENGGIRIEMGLDSNNNGELDAGEVIGEPKYICNGVDGEDGRSPIVSSTTDVACSNGGVELTFGYDDDGNGSIDEILETITICNGEDGDSGADGFNSIIKTSVSATCPNGGTLVEVGLDDNDNGWLDIDEVDNSFNVCNGANGSTGSDGRDIIMTNVFASCGGDGGRTYSFGYDNDDDGFIDEVITSFTVCNGSDGSSDGIFEFYFYEEHNDYSGTSDTYIDENDNSNFDESNLITSSGDRNSAYSLLRFELESILNTTDNFEILEAGIFLNATAQSNNENWIGVKALRANGYIFDETKATYEMADSDNTWTNEIFDPSVDAAESFMDMFRIPSSSEVSFEGVIPLQLNRTIVDEWINDKESNAGMVLELAGENITSQVTAIDSENDDKYLRPVLYIKIQDNNARGRSATISDDEYKLKWQSMSYEEKLAPLHRRNND